MAPKASLRAALNTAVGLSEIAFAVSCFILLNRWVRAEQQGRVTERWMQTLTSIGVFSYSLYPPAPPGDRHARSGDSAWSAVEFFATMLRIVVYVPICIASGYLFFIAVERHFLRHRKGQWTSWARGRAFPNWRGMVRRG